MNTEVEKRCTTATKNSDKSISVIIPVHNGSDTLSACLDSICNASGPVKEIIVVDDASSDDSVAIAKRFRCRVISHSTPQGAATARNTGASAASGELLFFTDSDIKIPHNCFKEIAVFMKQNPSCAMIGLLDEDTLETNFSSRYENYYMHHNYKKHTSTIGIFYTSAAVIPTKLFMDFKGFDENYKGASIEDMEFGQRIIRAGIPIFINKKLLVYHMKHFTLANLLKINFRKAEGTIKIKLRNLINKIKTPKLVAPPLAFTVGIPLTFLAILSMFTWLFWGITVSLSLTIAFVLTIMILNCNWLCYLLRKAGVSFVLKSIFMLLANYIAYGSGIVWGNVTFIAGKHY